MKGKEEVFQVQELLYLNSRQTHTLKMYLVYLRQLTFCQLQDVIFYVTFGRHSIATSQLR